MVKWVKLVLLFVFPLLLTSCVILWEIWTDYHSRIQVTVVNRTEERVIFAQSGWRAGSVNSGDRGVIRVHVYETVTAIGDNSGKVFSKRRFLSDSPFHHWVINP